MKAALEHIPVELRAALELAAERIRAFHQKQPLHSWIDAGERRVAGPADPPGRLGWCLRTRRHSALAFVAADERNPGAGRRRSRRLSFVRRPAVAMATFIRLSWRRLPSPVWTSCIASVAAQAIAAMAYGTDSFPRVATIVGAGNLFVTLAKQQVYGDVGIDGLLGPTETVVIADDSADPATCRRRSIGASGA